MQASPEGFVALLCSICHSMNAWKAIFCGWCLTPVKPNTMRWLVLRSKLNNKLCLKFQRSFFPKVQHPSAFQLTQLVMSISGSLCCTSYTLEQKGLYSVQYVVLWKKGHSGFLLYFWEKCTVGLTNFCHSPAQHMLPCSSAQAWIWLTRSCM